MPDVSIRPFVVPTVRSLDVRRTLPPGVPSSPRARILPDRPSRGIKQYTVDGAAHGEAHQTVDGEIDREALGGREMHGAEPCRDRALVHDTRGGERDEAAVGGSQRAHVHDARKVTVLAAEDVIA